MNLLVVEKPREKQLQQIRGDQADGALGRQVLPVQMVDSPVPRIGCEQLLRQLCHRDMHPASIPQTPPKGKPTATPANKTSTHRSKRSKNGLKISGMYGKFPLCIRSLPIKRSAYES